MCQYCGCYDNDYIHRFMDEHVTLINLNGDIRRAIDAGDHGTVKAKCAQASSLFVRHSEDEEDGIFHQMSLEDEVWAASIDQLCSEHQSLHEMLASIGEGNYEIFPAFQDQLRQHIDEEDNGLFPAANVSLSGDAWEQIGELMHQRAHERGEEHSHGEHSHV